MHDESGVIWAGSGRVQSARSPSGGNRKPANADEEELDGRTVGSDELEGSP
jgi:hypothetical protein